MTISSRVDLGILPCFIGVYIEIRDGLNQSANLLGILCEAFTKERVFRSSGHNMYLKFHQQLLEGYFHINYTAKPMNITGLKYFIKPFQLSIYILEVAAVGQFHSITPSLGHFLNPGRS